MRQCAVCGAAADRRLLIETAVLRAGDCNVMELYIRFNMVKFVLICFDSPIIAMIRASLVSVSSVSVCLSDL